MLTVYTIEQHEQWDAVVCSFSEYDVYYMSGYARGFRIHGDGEPLLIHYQDETVRGIHVIMKRDIATDVHFAGKIEPNTLFDIVTPYGYGGWLIEGDGATDVLFATYAAWCREQHIVSEFVRFHPVLKNHVQSADFYEVIPLGGTIAMDLTSQEVIWENITSKNRNMIRKAQNNGIEIKQAHDAGIYEIFRDIYEETMDKDEAASYYYFRQEYYQSLLDDMDGHASVFYAEREGEVIAAAVMLFANGRLNYHLSGSRCSASKLAPTNLLLYEAAKWGAENGYRTFHLGGGVGSGEDGLYKFKKSFYRQEPCRFHIGRKVWMEDVYQRLAAMRKDLPEGGGYFPRYRMASNRLK